MLRGTRLLEGAEALEYTATLAKLRECLHLS